jgi:hypothetical protein
MRLLRTTEAAGAGLFARRFVGYGSNPSRLEIELTYNHGVATYELGTATATSPSAMSDIRRGGARNPRRRRARVTRASPAGQGRARR